MSVEQKSWPQGRQQPPGDAPEQKGAGRRAQRQQKKKRRRWFLSAPPAPAPREDGLTPYNARGTRVRTSRWRAEHGYYAPSYVGAPSTTRQAEILNSAVVAQPPRLDAPILGRDMLSDAIVTHDQFLAHERGMVTSLNVLAVGDVGGGKSSTLKTVYVIRPLLMRDRRVVVFDRKPQGVEGEYAELTRTFGGTPVRFSLSGGGAIVNPLDPVIIGTGDSNAIQLLKVVAGLARPDSPLTEWEGEAIRCAYRVASTAAAEAGRAAVLPDVAKALGQLERDPSQEYAAMPAHARERLEEAGWGVRFLLNGLLSEYSGLFDGETSPDVQLENKLTSFDISQLPGEGPAVPTVMAIANIWLLGSLNRAREQRIKTYVINEEGWHLVGGPTAGLLKSNTKLSRAVGLSLVMAIHKLADIPPSSPAMAMLQEAQTVHIFQQSRAEDIARCVSEFNLDRSALSHIPALEPGFQLFKRGAAPELYVQHLRSELEEALTYTDEAIDTRPAATS